MKKHILFTLLMFCALMIQAQSAIDYSYGRVVYHHDTIARTATARIWGSLLNKTVVISDTVQKGQYTCVVTSLKREIMPCWYDWYAQYEEIYLPRTIRDIEDGTFDKNHHLKAIHIAEDNPYYTSIDGVLYDKKVERLITCPQAKADTLVLPKTVKRIDKKAFRNCHELAFIDVEEGNKVYHSECGLLLKKHTLIAYPAKKTGSSKVYNQSAQMQKEKKSKKEKEDQNKLSKTGWDYFYPGIGNYIDIYEGLCYLPASVHSIAPWAITCNNIHRFEVANKHKYFSVRNGVLYSKNEKTLVLYPGEWQNKHVLISEGVTTIAPRAFYQNQNIREVTLPTTLKKIGREAFYEMPILRNVYNYSMHVPQIGKCAFQTCPSEHAVSMFVPTQTEKYYDLKKWPDVYIYPQIFKSEDPNFPQCYMSVPDRLLVFEGMVYNDDLGLYAYSDIIERIQITSLGATSSPFISFPNVKEFEVLGEGGHMGMSMDGVLFTSWNRYHGRFSNEWHGWELVAFPPAKTGNYVVPDSVEQILDDAFKNCHLSTLTISDSVRYIDLFINNSEFEQFEVSPGNPIYCAIDGVLFRRDGVMRAYPRHKKDSIYTVPMGTEIISLAAFMNNTYLQEVHITDSVHTILHDAFRGCVNLRNVYLYATQPPYVNCTYPVYYERSNIYLFPTGTKIFVPEESLEAYKSADIWKDYADRIFPIPSKENE